MKQGSPQTDIFEEALAADLWLRARGERIARVRSAIQTVEIWQCASLGTVFRTDGCSMTATADEFIYHELLTHPALLPQPAARRALVLGGGDGGSTEEILKHPEVEQVRIIEIDPVVVDLARRHLSSVHRGAFDDPRVQLELRDAHGAVLQMDPAQARWDLIVFDLSGPEGPAAALYQEDFLRHCAALLAPRGALTLHLGNPWTRPAQVRRLLATLRAVFPCVREAYAWVPVYGALRAFALASVAADFPLPEAAVVDAQLRRRGILDLRYLDGAVSVAQGVRPPYLKTLLDG